MGPAWLFGNRIGLMTVPWLTARETATLVAVALSLLFFRAFREKCLLVWGAGWIAYGSFLWVSGGATGGELPVLSKPMAAFAQADFVLAIGLFAAAALMSAQARRELTILAPIWWVLAVFAAMRPMYFPDALYSVHSKTLGMGVDVACRLLAALAVIELLRHRAGRIGPGAFLFGAGLLTLNLNWPPFTSRIPNEAYLFTEVLFGASLLLIVLDDSRVRTRRLAVLNELTATIARGQNHAPMIQTALEKLKTIAGAKAAWFQLMDGDRLVPTQHAGLSGEFLRAITQFETEEAQTRVLQENRAAVRKLAEMPLAEREQLSKQGIRHAVLLPVVAVIGLLLMIWATSH